MDTLKRYWPLVVAVILYVIYAITGIYIARASIIVFLMCLCLYLIFKNAPKEARKKYLFVPLAFFFSIFGDLCLHLDSNYPKYEAIIFIAGVALYFIAHVWYICFTLRKGKINKLLLSILAVIFIVYFIFLLYPNISNNGIRIAVMLYILVSCVSVSSAAAMPYGPEMDRTAKILTICGISSLLFSDFLISLHDFVGIQTGYALMLPTFYLSQILVSGALIHLLDGRK